MDYHKDSKDAKLLLPTLLPPRAPLQKIFIDDLTTTTSTERRRLWRVPWFILQMCFVQVPNNHRTWSIFDCQLDELSIKAHPTWRIRNRGHMFFWSNVEQTLELFAEFSHIEFSYSATCGWKILLLLFMFRILTQCLFFVRFFLFFSWNFNVFQYFVIIVNVTFFCILNINKCFGLISCRQTNN